MEQKVYKAIKCDDGKKRCPWCTSDEQYISYHDNEWGNPVTDDRILFEKICLEGFQSGLSWKTILVKREHFRKAFKNFDYKKVAKFTDKDVDRLLLDAGIVRHRGKIEAVINNAKLAHDLVKEFGSLSNYFWSYEAKKKSKGTSKIQATSEESILLSKDLKKRGWKFVGPTTMYAFMQAMGLVNDHAKDCFKV
ncbi:methyladenine glycosylase [Bacteriovorax sp. BSW11_IV]|uniref:DNA-3-methyladenine glycosylase I n=1 Tax=Bacteriovorax sp. BSW11_IV TaxID=1353529 RepID=UPI000389E5F6|nr:DNA-3-methyladenine glycosylase I [Bacteriovorax sp. BSW11_IV]EQC48722.1 methyladenine glycosylase [Bacteriovorax sp. BSW11_IV]